MNDFTKNIAQALFNQDKINDLLRKELQQAVNDLLEAELTAFLGYNSYARCKRRLEYRQFGVTTREIADLIKKMYGSHYSPAQVSNISKQMIPKVEAYHKRKLSDKFFCVYLDATSTFLCAEKLLNVKLSILPLVSNLMVTRKLSTTALRPMKTLKSGRSCSKA